MLTRARATLSARCFVKVLVVAFRTALLGAQNGKVSYFSSSTQDGIYAVEFTRFRAPRLPVHRTKGGINLDRVNFRRMILYCRHGLIRRFWFLRASSAKASMRRLMSRQWDWGGLTHSGVMPGPAASRSLGDDLGASRDCQSPRSLGTPAAIEFVSSDQFRSQSACRHQGLIDCKRFVFALEQE